MPSVERRYSDLFQPLGRHDDESIDRTEGQIAVLPYKLRHAPNPLKPPVADVLLLLAGCTSEDDGGYGTVEELLRAMKSAGVECTATRPPEFQEVTVSNHEAVKSEPGECSLQPSREPVRVLIFADSNALDTYQVVAERMFSEIHGSNWLVQVEHPMTARRVSKAIGGTVNIPCHTGPRCTEPLVTVVDVMSVTADEAVEVLRSDGFTVPVGDLSPRVLVTKSRPSERAPYPLAH